MKVTDLLYRPHIDGIRAIAVILVILSKMFPSVFGGGYLGVDIFFVISGFVITQSLYKDYLTNGKINIVNFYVKRFKRLYPALVWMISVTTVAYVFFGFLWDTNLYLKSAVTAIFASSNLYFLFSGEGYFFQSLTNPLIHTWSLGVEEQFYVVYPLLLVLTILLVRKCKIRSILLSVIFLAGSVSLYVLFYNNPDSIFGEFYFPLARFWELAAGCSLFFFVQYLPSRVHATYVMYSSAVLLFGVQFFQSSIDNFQIETLLTVFATSGLIYAGIEGGGKLVALLKHYIVRYIGRISYSVYLWYLPVVYFADLYLDVYIAYFVIPVAIFALAAFSYHFVETPLRHSSKFENILKYGASKFLYLIVILVIFVGVYTPSNIRSDINHGFNTIGEYIKSFNYIESNFNLGARIRPDYTLGGNSAVPCSDISSQKNLKKTSEGLFSACLKKGGSDTIFYLTGDSHSFHFLNTLDRSQIVKDLYMVEIPRQMIVTKNPDSFDKQLFRDVMRNQKEQLQNLQSVYKQTYYVTSFFLSLRSEQIARIETNMREYVEELQDYATLIFIAPTPVFPAGPESCVLLGKYCEINVEKDRERSEAVRELLYKLQDEYENVYVYDPYVDICSGETCKIYDVVTDTLRFIDTDHLSVEESIRLSPYFDKWLQDTFNFPISK